MKIGFTYIALLIALTGIAQERSLTLSSDRQEIVIGEQVQLQLVLKSHAGDTVQFPIIGDTLITEVEVLNRSTVDTAYEGNDLSQRIFTQQITVTSFDSGYFPIPPRIATINGTEVLSNALLISVQTIDIDTAQGIYDIKAIVETPFSITEWLEENWKIFAIAIPALLLITLLSFWLLSRKPKKKEEPIIPTRPAHIIAMERLAAMETEQAWLKENSKPYYSELTDVLREYIEHRFKVPALEQTTEEIHASLRRNPDLSSSSLQELKQLLFLADLVKFAKEKPSVQEKELNLNQAKTFVAQTKLEEFVAQPENLSPDQPSTKSDSNG